jgi:hypothetical protein
MTGTQPSPGSPGEALTPLQQRLADALADIPRDFQESVPIIDLMTPALRVPFPAEEVGWLPRGMGQNTQKGRCKPKRDGGDAPDWQEVFCGGYHALPAVHLDYVGHAAVTIRLLQVDPDWSWEPLHADERGFPTFNYDRGGNAVGLWIKLTIGGKTRLGFGSCPAKVLIGDALRNAAMRFGVATELWVKGHEDDGDSDQNSTAGAPPAQQAPPPDDLASESTKLAITALLESLPEEFASIAKAEWSEAQAAALLHPLRTLRKTEVPLARQIVDRQVAAYAASLGKPSDTLDPTTVDDFGGGDGDVVGEAGGEDDDADQVGD